MSFTSFNPIQSQQTINVQNQPLTLKQGLVLNGTIKKLYPDQVAEIQVGGHKLLAKLETPLKAGDSHFFQVKSISPQTELKVVSGAMDASTSMKQQIHQLLDTMNLPKTNEMMQLVSHLLKEQVPISKEQLLQAQALLLSNENESKQDAIKTLQKIIEMKLPFTKEVFQAVLHGSKTNGFAEVMNEFTQSLVKDSSIPDNLKKAMIENLGKIAKPLDHEKGGMILSRAVQTLLDEAQPISTKLHAINLLKEAYILSKQATLTNWMQSPSNLTKPNLNQPLQYASSVIQKLHTINESNASNILNEVKSWVQNEPNLSQSQKGDLLTILNKLEQMPKQAQIIEQVSKQLNEMLLKAYASSEKNQPFTQNTSGTSVHGQLLSLLNDGPVINESIQLSNIARVANESNQPPIQQLNLQVEQQLKDALNGNAIQQAMKNVLKSLGINYESSLYKNIQEIDNISEQLKPQLLAIVNNEGVSTALKESADVLLARMNGMQLLSGENGHQHQIVMQVPLQLFGKSMDATLQWNGRMKEDGKIDSNYARILFYLDMESMKETVIDMQVQNRIVTINLFNEIEHLASFAEPLQKILKNRLEEKGYYLSGIFFRTFENSEPRKKMFKSENAQTSNGVDIRI